MSYLRTTTFGSLSENDVFVLDGKTYIVTGRGRRSGLMISIYADLDGTTQGWRIKRHYSHQVEIVGKKPVIRMTNINPGDLFIRKGRKGEAILYELVSMSGNTLIAINPLDGKKWTLRGGAFAKLNDVLNKNVVL